MQHHHHDCQRPVVPSHMPVQLPLDALRLRQLNVAVVVVLVVVGGTVEWGGGRGGWGGLLPSSFHCFRLHTVCSREKRAAPAQLTE